MNDPMSTRRHVPPFAMRVEEAVAGPVLAVSGEIDAVTAVEVWARVRDLLDGRSPVLVVDLSDVVLFGSSGTTVLVAAAELAHARAVALAVVVRPAALRVLRATGVDGQLVLSTERATALGALFPAPRRGDLRLPGFTALGAARTN